MSKIIGIDIAKQTFDAAILAPDGSILARVEKLPNTEQGFNQLLEAASPEAGGLFVMEASGPYYLPLAGWLHGQGLKVSVVNPLVIRHFCKMHLSRTKTDKKDALMIARWPKGSPWPVAAARRAHLQAATAPNHCQRL